MKEKRTLGQQLIFILLVVLATLFIFPVLFVLMNSLRESSISATRPLPSPQARCSRTWRTIRSALKIRDFSQPSAGPLSSQWDPRW